MTREELIRRLKEDMLVEETAIPIYAKHLPNTLFWSRLAEEDIGYIRAGLRKLATDSSRHRTSLKMLIQHVSEADQDVF